MKKILFFIFLSCSLFANLAGQAPTKIALRCPAPNPSSYSSIAAIYIGDIVHQPCPNRSSIFNGKVNFSGATVTGLFPVTTKGDLFTFSNVAARLGVGVNGQILSADNTTATGLKWVTGTGGTVTSVTSANGNATVANTTTTPVITIVQAPALKSATTTVDVSAATAPSANQVLTATNSTTATWQTPAAPGVGTVTSVTSANGNATVANTTTTPVITIVKAPAWTTARNLAGNSVDGSGNVAFANKFIVQGTTDTGLSGPQFLGALGTGIVKNTTTTGFLSIAANSDLPVMSATVGGAVPTPPNNTTTFLRGDGTFNTPASSGVTNSAGANVITKSNGTNLVASRITDSGTVIDIGDSQNQGAGIYVDNGASKEVDLGDVGNNNNLTHISIQDSTANKSISLQAAEAINLDSRTGKTQIGDVNGSANYTLLTVNDTGKLISVDSSTGATKIGDILGAGSGTVIIVDDGNTAITLQAGAVNTAQLRPLSAGGYTIGTAPLPYSKLFLGATANNTAQLTGTFTGNRIVTIPDASFTISQAGTTGRVTTKTAAAAGILTYTVGATDQSFTVSGNVLVTASVTHSFTMTVSYTDESNAARVLTLNFSQVAGSTFSPLITNTSGTGPYEGVPLHIRCKASTTITFATVGTFTSVTYNAEGSVQPI